MLANSASDGLHGFFMNLFGVLLCVEVEVDVEDVSEVPASAAAPQFGSDLCKRLCLCPAICSSSPTELPL